MFHTHTLFFLSLINAPKPPTLSFQLAKTTQKKTKLKDNELILLFTFEIAPNSLGLKTQTHTHAASCLPRIASKTNENTLLKSPTSHITTLATLACTGEEI